jgi:hypothetical protein
MAIRSKPKQMPEADTRQIDAIIDKGGSVATITAHDPGTPAAVENKLIQLRLPPELVERIDRARRTRTVPPSRHAWMLEAIFDKLGND